MPYHITSTNCGVCPNITSNTSVTCTDISVDGRTCLVVIQTKGDGNNSEHSEAASTNLTIELQGKVWEIRVYTSTLCDSFVVIRIAVILPVYSSKCTSGDS